MKWTKIIAASLSVSTLFFAGAALTNPSQALAATYTVTKTEDTNDGTCDADCSLREAVEAANTNAGHDTIEFDIPTSDAGYVPASGGTQAHWVIESSSTFTLSDDAGVTIDGYSQPGASRNTAEFGETVTAVLTITLKLNTFSGYLALEADNNHISGLNIYRTQGSQVIGMRAGSSNNWIEGNFFGTDITGLVNAGGGNIGISNITGDGQVENNNILGTNGDGDGDVGERNLIVNGISWNNGVDFQEGTGHVIAGNYFGVDKTGRRCINQNANRVIMQTGTGSNNRIGTNFDGVSDTEEANIIACVNANARGLIRVLGGESNSYIQGNYIGTNPHGDILSDFEIPGIYGLSGSGIMIKGNTIAHNAGGAIALATTPVGFTFSENKIYGNEELDIDLVGGVESGRITFNDPGDIDTGPNDLMNYPEIEGAEYLGGGRYKIWGWLEGNLSEAPFTIEVCKSSNHPSGHGGCLESLGTMTTSERMWSMEVTVPGDSEGSLSTFTALATNKNGSTSEFGPNFGGSIPGPGAPAPTPKKPDLLATHSGFTVKNDVISFAPPATFLWDVYLDVSHTPQTGTRRVSGAYWQASGIYNAWYKAFFNDAKIMPEVIATPYLLAIKYDPIKLDPNLPEGNLKLAYSEDGEVWKVLPNSVLDMVNKTVAVVTKQGGYYMLVSGYPN